MSRIGKQAITLPKGVTVNVSPSERDLVTVKGPKGELKEQLDRDIKVNVDENEITLSRPTEQIRHKALHGLYGALDCQHGKGCYRRLDQEPGTGRCRLPGYCSGTTD